MTLPSQVHAVEPDVHAMPVALSLHGVPLGQHAAPPAVQAWPDRGPVHVFEPEPLPVMPPQVPYVWPGVNTQVRPLQQSPVLVHMPVVLTQPPPHTRWPWPSGTHGAALQQSVAVAQ